MTGEYPPLQGGVGDYTHALGSMLCAQGVDVHVLTVREAAGDHLRPHRGGPEPQVHPVMARWGWRTWWWIQQTAREVQADIVHIQYQAAAYRMHPAVNLVPKWFLQMEPRLKLAVTFHDLRVPYLFPKAGPLRRWVILRLARSADVAITTNAADFQALQAAGGIRMLDLIPIGSNIEVNPPPDFDRAAWRAQWGLRQDDVLLSYFGFVNASKGGETLALALAELVRRGVPAHLVMIGGQVGASDPTNYAYLNHFRSLIERLGLSDRVHWTGYVPSSAVSAHLLASDICVLPYRDGASFRRGSLMAALAHGLPIISTRLSGEQPVPTAFKIPSLAHGKNIVLVAPDSPSQIADAVQRLMADPAMRRQIAEGARQLSEAFRWEDIAQRHVEVYRAIQSG
ncbi:MAG: glycosyltransferase family 4 protein [Anaerolineae bacterium]